MRGSRLFLFILVAGVGSYDLVRSELAAQDGERHRETARNAEKRYSAAADRLEKAGLDSPGCAPFPKERFSHCACSFCRGKVARQLCTEFPYAWCDLSE
jgi:hypothetical protein